MNMRTSVALVVFTTALFICIQPTSGLPIWKYLTGTANPSDSDVTGAASIDFTESRDDRSTPLLRYDTMVPILQVILTPIGRMIWPSVEQWFSGIFGAYLDSANRAIDSLAQYATDNISFQTGDVYYSKNDMIDGHGYQSLIVTLPSGRTITLLTFKTKNKFNILDEFPQLTEAQNEVRELM